MTLNFIKRINKKLSNLGIFVSARDRYAAMDALERETFQSVPDLLLFCSREMKNRESFKTEARILKIIAIEIAQQLEADWISAAHEDPEYKELMLSINATINQLGIGTRF